MAIIYVTGRNLSREFDFIRRGLSEAAMRDSAHLDLDDNEDRVDFEPDFGDIGAFEDDDELEELLATLQNAVETLTRILRVH